MHKAIAKMPKRPPNQTRTARIKNVSGARGGVSTSRGLNYQIYLAILHTLELISRALCAPHKNWQVRIEPRTVSPNELATWDLGFDPEDLLIEAKLQPRRPDIEEWLGRVAIDGERSLSQSFHLIYHKGAGPHLELLGKLIRLAKEAKGDSGLFHSLLRAEEVNSDDRFLAILGARACDLLSRMKLEQVPEYLLEQDINLRARVLAGEVGGKRLRDYLFDRFYNAAPHRNTILVRDLIHEARGLGVQFQPPPDVDTNDLSELARSALIILQACKAGIPTEVVAAALDCSADKVKSELQELHRSNVVMLDEELWSMKPLETPISSTGSAATLAKALSSVLSFIHENEVNAYLSTQIRNAIHLLKECTLSYPKLVANAFVTLDKPLKRLGNKRQVWYVANLSIQAVKAVHARDRDRDLVDAEARALICGTSWAFQRLHKLENARVDAHRSLELARDAGLDRTLAYCLKCLGRLCRMEAEGMSAGEVKGAKLSESISLLKEAIDKFSALEQFGPAHPEVGDCYSLLSRTYLELNQISEAQDEMRKAYRLITDEGSKDYMDLVILNGDLDAAIGDRVAAHSNYNRALEATASTDPEISEMRARAFYKRGANRLAQGQITLAKKDYENAAQIWTALEDYESAAGAAWEEIRLTTPLPEPILELLNRERATVRVETLREHIASLNRTAKKSSVARRSAPPLEYWIQKIREAKARLTSRNSEL